MMKGLLIKDFKLLKGQRHYFLLIILLSLVLARAGQTSSFVITYMTTIGSVFTLSTISYDEFDNGNAFLFSLPITRKSYTVEKYLFGLMLGGASWLFSVIITAIAASFNDVQSIRDMLIEAVMILSTLLIVLAVLLPVQFKFGSEKGRIIMAIMAGFVVVLALNMNNIIGLFQIDWLMLEGNSPMLGIGGMIAAVFVLGIIAFLLSITISIRIMNKKEF